MKIKHFFYLCFLATFALVSGCETMPDPKTELTATAPMNGEWWVSIYVDDDPDTPGNQLVDVGGGYYHFITYNTAANKPDSLWMDDFGGIWPMNCKVGLNLSSKSFTATNARNLATDDLETPEIEETINVTNGKVLSKAVTTPNKNVTDSIYFEAEFSSDPGTIYVFGGYRRTQFKEDDH